MTSVSVVIPCYKYGHFLEEAVTSVLDDQQGVDVRVLIIDDASPDDSAEVASKIAARDSRVEVAVHATNKGNIATFNEGLLEWADGDYSVLMSADDQLAPGPCGAPGICLTPILTLDLFMGIHCGSRKVRHYRWPGRESGVGQYGRASGGWSVDSVTRRTPLQRRRSSYARRCRSAWVDIVYDCPLPQIWRSGCGWRRTAMLALYVG